MIAVIANKHRFELSGARAPRSVHHFSSSRFKPKSMFRQRNNNFIFANFPKKSFSTATGDYTNYAPGGLPRAWF